MSERRALITGITGQDGSYLAELLLEKGYRVFGLTRRTNTENCERIEHLLSRIEMVHGDLLDQNSLGDVLRQTKPDEVYNLAAQSFVPASIAQPVLTGDITGLGAARLLEAIRGENKGIRFYQASTSEMFGRAREVPQTERTPFHPRSPYGVAKVYAHWLAVCYREAHGMFCCSGITYNHESPRRGLEYVTRKITDGVARIVAGKARELSLGSLDGRRDWGFAGDYVRAMWLMLQQDRADDYVVATGETHSVGEFVETAFGLVGLDWREYVVANPQFQRPADAEAILVGDATKARTVLGWRPQTSFGELVEAMLRGDLARHGVPSQPLVVRAREATS